MVMMMMTMMTSLIKISIYFLMKCMLFHVQCGH